MADDKGGGGGGWEWGALEIIIGILLIVGVLDHVFGNKSIGSVNNSDNGSVPVAVETTGDLCGLTLARPIANEKVGSVITVAGSVGECDWKQSPTVALYGQLVDSKGKPVSGYIAIPPTQSRDGYATFDATIALIAKPTPGTGYLILVPAVQPGGSQTVSVRVPLKF